MNALKTAIFDLTAEQHQSAVFNRKPRAGS
jgi:hypothetical protein